MWFGIGFISGIVIFTLVFRNMGIPSPFPVGELWAVIIFQVFVLTFAEETFFRKLLTSRIGIIPSALAFGAFHYAAYTSQVDFSYILFITPFIFGLAFGYLYLKTRHFGGIGLVWALHATWNLAVLGVSFF
jgi:membrane protease YdiL (CAAX protease family)